MDYNQNSGDLGIRGGRGWRGENRGCRGGYQNDRNYRGGYQQGGEGQFGQGPNYAPVTVGRLDISDEGVNSSRQQQPNRRGDFGHRPAQSRGNPYQQKSQLQGYGYEQFYRNGGGNRNQKVVINPYESGYSYQEREPEAGSYQEDSQPSYPVREDTQESAPVLVTPSGFSVRLNGKTSRLQGRVERMSQEEIDSQAGQTTAQDRGQNATRPKDEEEKHRYRGGFGQREPPQDRHQMGLPRQGQWQDRPQYNRYQEGQEHCSSYRNGFGQRESVPDRPRGGFTRGGGRGGGPSPEEIADQNMDRTTFRHRPVRVSTEVIAVPQVPRWQIIKEEQKRIKAERKKLNTVKVEYVKSRKMRHELPEKKIYRHGVNSDGRSDYELTEKIPTFSQEEKESDRKTCEHIHKIITRNDLNVEGLHLEYLSVFLEKEEEPVLKTPEDLAKFLENHRHVFWKRLGKSTLTNRGFGYRRCMVYICCIILSHESDDQGVRIADIFHQIDDLPTYSFSGPWNDDWIWNSPLSEIHLVNFFSRHPEIFELNESENTVKITESAKKISTVWDSTILSLPPPPSNKEVYWDFSRVENFIGYVFATVDEYCSVRITAGYFKNRHVYCLASDMGMSFERFSNLYPTGCQVVGTAHFTMHAKNEFRCIQMQEIGPDGKVLRPRKPVVEEEEEEVLVCSKEDKDLVEKVFMRSLEEEEIVTRLDELLVEKRVKWDEIEERRKTIQNDENNKTLVIFSSMDSLKTALQIRPHLYRCQTLGVSVYSKEERDSKLFFLRHLCKVTSENAKELTMEELASSFAERTDDEKLRQFGEKDKLEVAIKKLAGIVGMKADAAGDPWTLLCFVDGIYYSKHKNFLPKFSPHV